MFKNTVERYNNINIEQFRMILGHFTFWLRPWLSLLAEPKTTLSRR